MYKRPQSKRSHKPIALAARLSRKPLIEHAMKCIEAPAIHARKNENVRQPANKQNVRHLPTSRSVAKMLASCLVLPAMHEFTKRPQPRRSQKLIALAASLSR